MIFERDNEIILEPKEKKEPIYKKVVFMPLGDSCEFCSGTDGLHHMRSGSDRLGWRHYTSCSKCGDEAVLSGWKWFNDKIAAMSGKD